jgi:AcrR family transcriptional regulator
VAKGTAATPPARERIGSAARDLFIERGYAATTIEAIARAADVGVSTVYAIFGNKREILADLRRRWFDEAEVETLVSDALASDDPRRKLDLCARWVRRQLDSGQSISAVFEEAARVDPEVGAYLADLRHKPEAKIAQLVRSLEPSLAADVPAQDAEAIIWALARGGVYRELVQHRGWSPDRYEAWFADLLQYQLFGARTRVAG